MLEINQIILSYEEKFKYFLKNYFIFYSIFIYNLNLKGDWSIQNYFI